MALRDLSTEQYILEMDEDLSSAYQEMRDAEREWVEACDGKAGIEVLELSGRRWLIVVDPRSALPDYSEMERTRAVFSEQAQTAAQEQKKMPTIGTRTTKMPEWAGGGLIHIESRPLWVADRVRWRRHEAYRGSAITVEEALDLLSKRFETFRGYLTRAKLNHQTQRIERLKQRCDEIESAYEELARLASAKGEFAALVRSGHSLRLSIRGRDEDNEKISIDESIPSITLVPGTSETVIEEAPKRRRTQRYERVADADGIILLRRTW